MNYLDTSALVKRFVSEKGSSFVSRIITQEGPIATAKIAYAEVFASFARKLREGHLTKPKHALACRQFEADWPAYIRVDLFDELLVIARDLIQRHPLRGYDAIHLASAISLKNGLGQQVSFSAADERLLRAAEKESLEVINVEK